MVNDFIYIYLGSIVTVDGKIREESEVPHNVQDATAFGCLQRCIFQIKTLSMETRWMFTEPWSCQSFYNGEKILTIKA